ncbi:MAG TPA: glutamate synthase-related protein, partial [Thermoleophilia bacterium]|nr:glutamate synthase-related protein [Thermoleophilia bacterium]
PIVVGPRPLHEGVALELAYLQASADADEAHDLKTRTLVVVEAPRARLHAAELLPYAPGLMVRLAPADAAALGGDGLRELVAAARIVELDPWGGEGGDGEGGGDGGRGGAGGGPGRLAALAATVRAANPDCLLSVFVRHDGDAFWARLEEAARHDGVALVHYHAGALKSYRLTPAVDRFLKDRLLRARVQLLAAGGDDDTQASAATVYESVLLGANGGAMTHAAAIALVPEAVDAFAAAGTASVDALSSARDAFAAAVRAVPPTDLREMARCTLTCWQHSILDFLSCMGIDDVKKTSGNTMAITVTEDWVREVDALATGEFGAENARVNAARVEAEPVPPDVRARFAVSSLLRERSADLPLVRAAQVLAQRTAGVHLSNSNAALNADFLDIIYRMAAGELPREDDFVLEGDPGRYGLDRIGLRVSRASVAWSLARLRRDASLLDYVSLAVPRGFERPGAAAPAATVSIHAAPDARPLLRFDADERGGFEQRVGDDHPLAAVLAAADLNGSAAAERTGSAAPAAASGAAAAADGSGAADSAAPLWLRASGPGGGERLVELQAVGHGAHGACVVRASADGAVTLRRDPRGGLVLSGVGIREPIWHGPVCHASTSLGAASEDFLTARVEGNVGLSMTSSGEGGPIKLARDDDMRWESLQVASGHFGVTGRDLRRVCDVEIKINQGAKPGKGGRLSGAKVTPTVSKARNIPVGTDALSPDPKHDIYSIEDMPAEVWLWLLYHNHCGIKITGSNYTRYVAAGMWSNFVVDYLLVDAGMGGSGNYHADSSHVGWPDAFRTMLHTHHALLGEKVDLDCSGELKPLRDGNGAPFGAKGGTRLFASGGLRGELDMLKVLIAGADGLLEGSIGKAVAFGCNQCGNCHLDCPRGGITTKPELMVQNDRELMRRRFRNWTVLNMVKLAVLVDALNRESGALAEDGSVADEDALLDDIRKVRGRTDLLEMPQWPAAEDDLVPPPAAAVAVTSGGASGPPAPAPAAAEHDSCRVGSLTVSEPVDVAAIWEAARLSSNGGNNRGGGLAWAGFAPAPVRGRCCLVVNTLGHDRAETLRAMLEHLGGCGVYGADGAELAAAEVAARLDDFRLPVRERYAGPEGWRLADLREDPGDFHLFFVEPRPDVLARYGRTLLAGGRWLQRRTKYGELGDDDLAGALDGLEAVDPPAGAAVGGRGATGARLAAF